MIGEFQEFFTGEGRWIKINLIVENIEIQIMKFDQNKIKETHAKFEVHIHHKQQIRHFWYFLKIVSFFIELVR